MKTVRRRLGRIRLYSLALASSFVGFLVVLSEIMRQQDWTDRLLGKATTEHVRMAVINFVGTYIPRDTDEDTVLDLVEFLELTDPFDYYDGQKCGLVLRGALPRQTGFCYAGERSPLDLRLEVGNHGRTNAMPAPGSRFTLDLQGGRLACFDGSAAPENALNYEETGFHNPTVFFSYYAPDQPGRELALTATIRGPRDFDAQYHLKVLGHPGHALPARSVIKGDTIEVEWDAIPDDHAGCAIEFHDRFKDWLIVADAAPKATHCSLDLALLAPIAIVPTNPQDFRIMPYTR